MADAIVHTGFVQYHHLLDHKVSKIGIEQVYGAVQASLAEYSRETTELFNRFVDPTPATDVYKYNTRLTKGLKYQPMSWDTSLKPQTVTGFYEVGLPIKMAGLARQFNRQTKSKVTLRDINDWVDQAIQADLEWRRHYVLSAMLWEDSWTFTDKEDPEQPALTVYPLANGDTTRKYTMRGAGDPVADDHYLAQANDIGAGADNPFKTIFDELYEHPENGLAQNAYVISFVADDLTADIENLATLKEVKESIVIAGITDDRVSEGILDLIGAGDKVIGLDGQNVIVQYGALPAGKILSIAPTASMAPLKRREEMEESMRGVVVESEMLGEQNQKFGQWRREGYGVQNPISACVTHIGDGTYQNPATHNPTKG